LDGSYPELKPGDFCFQAEYARHRTYLRGSMPGSSIQ
jgi:hypothetical protein